MTVPHIDDPRLPQRFWDKVVPEPNTGCWLWTAAIGNHGYGVYGRGGGRANGIELAHRAAYIALVGPYPEPPDGHYRVVTDHLCRQRSCVNPAHLEVVTDGENVRRGRAGDEQKAKAHCPKGHPYAGDNLIVRKHGRRACRACHRAANAVYDKRRRAKVP